MEGLRTCDVLYVGQAIYPQFYHTSTALIAFQFRLLHIIENKRPSSIMQGYHMSIHVSFYF